MSWTADGEKLRQSLHDPEKYINTDGFHMNMHLFAGVTIPKNSVYFQQDMNGYLRIPESGWPGWWVEYGDLPMLVYPHNPSPDTGRYPDSHMQNENELNGNWNNSG